MAQTGFELCKESLARSLQEKKPQSYVKKVWHGLCKAENENDSQNDKMKMIIILKMIKLKTK